MVASDDKVRKLRYLAKVLAALIVHCYQNKALSFTSRFPLSHSRPMERSEEHDVLFLREMLAINIFGASMKPKPELFRRDPFLEMVSAYC